MVGTAEEDVGDAVAVEFLSAVPLTAIVVVVEWLDPCKIMREDVLDEEVEVEVDVSLSVPITLAVFVMDPRLEESVWLEDEEDTMMVEA